MELRMVPESIIKQAAHRLAQQFKPERIILFGSQARGEATRHSDVDLLVIGPFSRGRLNWMIKMNESLKGLEMSKDIVVLSHKEYEEDKEIPGTLARAACREGKVLYAARP
jgi:predicted nucleotidyltransferase